MKHKEKDMEIKGKVHCLFEQSGTFKNEFKNLGYEAFDYDIQNNFCETDFVVDLFAEIEKGYEGGQSIFDSFTKDDLILAFFPCIYFCQSSALAFRYEAVNYKNLTHKEASLKILQRSRDRQYFYELALKLFAEVEDRGLRMIVENPYSPLHYLEISENFPYIPRIIDKDRQKRGDYFKKPTAYWFVNCDPSFGESYTIPKEKRIVLKCKGASQSGLCSEERSMISPDYARNFICDFILGKPQANSQLSFDF